MESPPNDSQAYDSEEEEQIKEEKLADLSEIQGGESPAESPVNKEPNEETPAQTEINEVKKEEKEETPKKKERPKDARSRKDFEFGDVLGEGSYAQVVIGKEISTSRVYAVKILNKKHIVRENKVEYVKTEKLIMDQLNHPNIVKLYFTFQDPQFLYFVLEYCPNGEMFDLIKKHGSFDVDTARFYAAELLNALEHMHKKDCIHRDLKPENILLSKSMHSKLTDFGTAKELVATGEGDLRKRAMTFTGTAEYVSPEVLNDQPATEISDIWAFGCTLYQMIAGLPPFQAINEYHIFQKIQARDFSFPEGFPEVAHDLVDRILVLNPEERLTLEEIKQHKFFEGFSFDTSEVEPPTPKTGLRQPPPEQPTSDGDPFSNFDGMNELYRQQKLSEQKGLVWSKFLFPNEIIVRMGPITKRKGFSVKKRQLILTDFPRLIYIDPIKLVQKGEIEWADSLRAEQKKGSHFLIHTPKRSYNCEDLTGKSHEWIEAIAHAQERRKRKESIKQ